MIQLIVTRILQRKIQFYFYLKVLLTSIKKLLKILNTQHFFSLIHSFLFLNPGSLVSLEPRAVCRVPRTLHYVPGQHR